MAQIQTSSGIQISYDSNKERIISENLSVLINSIRSGNLSVGFHVSASLLVISSIIQVGSIKDEELIASLAFAAGVEIQVAENIELQTFIEALGRKAYDYMQRPSLEYHLLFPLNIPREKIPFKKIAINREAFEVLTWEETRAKYDIPALVADINGFFHVKHDQEYWNDRGSVLLLKFYNRSAEEAFRRGEKAFDNLLSSINYILDTSISIHFTGNPPNAKVIPSVGYGVFRPTGELDLPYIDKEFLDNQRLCSDEIDPNKLQALLNIIRSDRKVDQRFTQALRLHNDGLKTTNWDTAFLSFWRVFETLAFGERTDYDMNDVVKRIFILLRADSSTKDFLNLCAGRRNNLVHRGIFTSEEMGLALTIKVYSKLCLKNYEKLIFYFGTEQMIEKYYELASLSNEQLTEQQFVIQTILSKELDK